MASVSPSARLVYIEPNDVASLSGSYINKTDGNLDNVSWQTEDLTYSVDLQVAVPDINDCGLVDYNDKYFNFSINGGNKIKGNRYLTDEYVNVSYAQLCSDGKNNRENLGMNSINIDFNHYFFPEVTVTFTDVRGSGLMMPAEEEYRQSLDLKENGREKTFENLYSALFHFPYPKFYLTVKGFYGTRVTFELAVNDFKTEFNAASGGFNITLKFIGYLYGLYTDIPMNYLIIAPYIDSEGDGKVGSYWSNNSNFTYTDGTRMITFIDFLDRFVRISETIAKEKNQFSDVGSLQEYKDTKTEITEREELKNSYIQYLDSVRRQTNSANESDDVFIVKGAKYNAYFVKSYSNSNAENLYVNNNIVSELSDKLSKFANSFKYPSIGKEDRSTDRNIVATFSAVPIENSDLSLIRQLNLDSELINAIDASDIGSSGYKKVAIINHYGTVRDIESSITEYEAKLFEIAENADNEINSVITKGIGFNPTIRNVYRMLFAHLDTFMHFIYNQTLRGVKDDITQKTRVTVGDAATNGLRLDIPKKNRDNSNYALPPFPGFYRNKDNKWEMEFPTASKGMREINLIEQMLSAVLVTQKNVSNINEFVTENGIFSTEVREEVSKMNFFPTILGDYFRFGKNPYEGLEYTGIGNGSALGEILYMALYRVAMTKTTKPLSFVDDKENNELQAFIIEACNYYLTNKKPTDGDKEMLSMINNVDDAKKFLNIFISNHKPQLLSDVRIDGSFITFKNKYSYFNNCYKVNNDVLDLSKTEDSFHIFDSSEKESINQFINNDNLVTDPKFNDVKFGICYDRVKVTIGDSYFEKYYNHRCVNKLFRIASDGEIKSKLGEGEHKEDKEQYEIAEELYLNNNIRNYRMSSFLMSGYCKYGDLSTNEGKAFFVLSLMPFNDDCVIAHLRNLCSSNFFMIPKMVLLYLGGWFYRYKNKDIGIAGDSNRLTKGKDGMATSEGEEVDGTILSEIDDKIADILVNEFVNWSKTDECRIIWEGIMGNNKETVITTDNGYRLFEYPHNLTEDTIIKLYIEQSYILNERVSVMGKVNLENLLGFVSQLNKFYADIKTNVEDRQIEPSDVSEEIKLSIYRTLKTLNDKWLNAYTYNNFRLDEAATETANKKRRFELNEYNNDLRKESNSFVFIDTFHTDIGDEFRINPKTIYDMITAAVNAQENYSVYQFMADLCQKNKLLFITLPVYNNYYDSNTIKRIFTPNPIYDERKYLGNTYVCAYVYEPSHLVDNDAYKSEFGTDGLLLTKDNTEASLEQSEALQMDYVSADTLEMTIPAFGVTFGRQNQSYFKSIEINMDTPKNTDYGILNLLELSKLGGKGFSSEPFAVGQDIFSNYSNRSYTCTVEMMGCMNITPLMYFQLNNVPMFKGAYMIVKVNHEIKPGNVTTRFTGVRVNKNQLPFNKDLFNVNMFASLLDNFQSTGSRNKVSTTRLSTGGATTVATKKVTMDSSISSNKDRIKSRLKSEFDWSDIQVAGVLGNIYQESRFNPASINKGEKQSKGPNKDAYAYGAGLIQWTFSSRKLRVLSYVNKGLEDLHNVTVGTTTGGPGGIEGCSLDEQITMLVMEMRKIFPMVITAISKCQTVEESATTFYYLVERRPKNVNTIYRISDMDNNNDKEEARNRTAYGQNFV